MKAARVASASAMVEQSLRLKFGEVPIASRERIGEQSPVLVEATTSAGSPTAKPAARYEVTKSANSFS